MKSIWLVLLVAAVALLVTVESRRNRKPGKGKGDNRKPYQKGEHASYLTTFIKFLLKIENINN